MGSCRAIVDLLPRADPSQAAARVIKALRDATAAEAGLIAIDSRGRLGFAHNAAAMEIALLEATGRIRHLSPRPTASVSDKSNL